MLAARRFLLEGGARGAPRTGPRRRMPLIDLIVTVSTGFSTLRSTGASMEDLALELLARILAWMRPHERDVVLSAYRGRYRSPGEYVRRELADWILGPL